MLLCFFVTIYKHLDFYQTFTGKFLIPADRIVN